MIGDETFLPLLLISGRGEGNLLQYFRSKQSPNTKNPRVLSVLVPLLSSLLKKCVISFGCFKKYAHICTEIYFRYL
ncbi:MULTISPECIES: hypothetical protein [Bacteroides]|jgi:hypothetical protein|uniref:hypothetical protein n=1 Tax=Bacteroides TaxID=816 RepID=UPI0025900E46|nr:MULTISPECIES: hypothetical protein [Bacteroides]